MRILIIEDDTELASTLVEQLKPMFTVDCANNGEDGLVFAKNSNYDLITIDVGLPDISGLEVCNQIRQAGILCPILMLTGVSETETKVEALDSGADDFLVKPFHLVELLARVRALLRRSSTTESQNILQAGDLWVDTAARKVRRNNNEILLRRREYDILELLVRQKGHIVNRQAILDHVCKNENSSFTNTIDVHIKRLRDKIDRPFAKKLIRTAHGIGYGIIP